MRTRSVTFAIVSIASVLIVLSMSGLSAAADIKVTAVGRASAPPDQIEVTLTLTAKKYDYAEAMSEAASQLDRVRDALAKVGIKQEDIRTSDMSIGAEYTTQGGSKGEYKRVFEGYRVDDILSIRFDMDTDLLARVLSALAESGTQPAIGISLGIRDTAPLADAALAQATAAAERRARVLCKASGIELGEIVSIDCARGTPEMIMPTTYRLEAADMKLAAVNSPKITPTDLVISETVTVIWSTK